ncbi:hypothetical protein X975_23889, partial [Stegodyphus mimosarum]
MFPEVIHPKARRIQANCRHWPLLRPKAAVTLLWRHLNRWVTIGSYEGMGKLHLCLLWALNS